MNELQATKRNWIYLFAVMTMFILEPYTYVSMYKLTQIKVFMIIALVLLVGLIVNLTADKNSVRISESRILVAMGFFCLLLLNKLITRDESMFSFHLMITIGLAYLFSEIFDFTSFKAAYCRCMSVLCVYSLLATYTILAFQGFFLSRLPSLYHGDIMMRFVDAGLCFVYVSDYGALYRNYGLFREPGVFQFYIIIAMILELWYKNRKTDRKRMSLYVVALASTFSTIGLICGSIIVLSFILFSENGNQERVQGMLVFFLILLGFLFLYLKVPILQENLGNSFNKFNGNGSMVSRTGSFKAYLSAWLIKPITGWGYSGGVFQAGSMFLAQYTKDNTNTIVTNFAFFGLLYGMLYQYLLIKLVAMAKQPILIKFAIFVALMLSINSQRFIESTMIFILFFYSMPSKQKTG